MCFNTMLTFIYFHWADCKIKFKLKEKKNRETYAHLEPLYYVDTPLCYEALDTLHK